MYVLQIYCDCLDSTITDEEYERLPPQIKSKYDRSENWVYGNKKKNCSITPKPVKSSK